MTTMQTVLRTIALSAAALAFAATAAQPSFASGVQDDARTAPIDPSTVTVPLDGMAWTGTGTEEVLRDRPDAGQRSQRGFGDEPRRIDGVPIDDYLQEMFDPIDFDPGDTMRGMRPRFSIKRTTIA